MRSGSTWCPTSSAAATADRLVDLIREAGTHLGTGFLATPDLLPVLVEAGHADVAFELLLQDTPPSWLTMVDRRATTVWEEWEGIDAAGVAHASLNHYSKGAVISFLHEYVAGIRLDADEVAYRRFRIEPLPGGGITWAEGVHDSPVRAHRVVLASRRWPVPPHYDDPVGYDRRRPAAQRILRRGRTRHPVAHLPGPVRRRARGQAEASASMTGASTSGLASIGAAK